MAHKISKKVIACILVLAFVLQSIPMLMFMVSGEFQSENLFQTHLESKHEAVYQGWMKSEVWDEESGTYPDVARFNSRGALDGSVDGNLDTSYDVYSYSDTSTNLIGARYHLDDVYYCGELKLYSGLSDRKDIYKVYASDSLDTLYNAESLVTERAVCDGTVTTVEINREVKYIAIFLDNVAMVAENTETKNKDGRVKEFQLWSADQDAGDEFVPENLFQTHLESKHEAVYQGWMKSEVWDEESGTYPDVARFNSRGALDGSVDGNLDTSYDVYSYSDTSTNLIGARYHLDDVYYCGELKLYSGLSDRKDIYKVYASDSLDTLYNAESLVTERAVCDGTVTTVEINREVKYIAIFLDNVAMVEANTETKNKDGRVIEFQLWSADKDAGDEFESENLFRTQLDMEKTHGILVNIATGAVQEHDRFNEQDPEALDKTTDGDLTGQAFVAGANTWETPQHVGAVYALDDVYFADKLTLYSGVTGYTDTYRVYASDSLDDLYDTANLVTPRDAECADKGTPVDVEIGKRVKYIAIIDTNGSIRAYEYELWSGKEPEEPEEPEPDESLKVLTIGNSFSENASAYASEIAAVNGLSLTFGYLKFPSCTIARHYEAAVNNKAVFKFEITDPTGKRTTIKQEAASWDSPDSKKCATIREALEYMDWDVIVFQQESYTSLDASSFADLPKLIEYVKGFCPDARLMIHEVWAWGTWENDPDKDFSKIKANYEAAAEANGLAIIPSGLGFEYAREALGDYTIVNENDGHYQHANSYGKYVAGCCYVGALFGVTIEPDTFKEHAEINKDGYAEQLTAAANKAILYYSSCAEGNHSYVEKVDAEYLKSAATCTKKAVYYKSCSVCGDKSDETFEYGDVDGTKHGETEVRDAVAATEEQEGYTGDTYCKDCGKKIASGTTIPKLEHTHHLVKTEAKPATHYEAGNLEYYRCSVCGKYYKDSDATVETTLEEVTIAKGEHSYSYKSDENGHWEECECGDKLQSAAHTFGQWVVTKDPTATEKGSQERTCSVCGYREVAEIDAIGGDTEPEDPSSGEQDPPVTGRDASFVMLAFILLMSSAGIGAVAVKAKRKPQ